MSSQNAEEKKRRRQLHREERMKRAHFVDRAGGVSVPVKKNTLHDSYNVNGSDWYAAATDYSKMIAAGHRRSDLAFALNRLAEKRSFHATIKNQFDYDTVIRNAVKQSLGVPIPEGASTDVFSAYNLKEDYESSYPTGILHPVDRSARDVRYALRDVETAFKSNAFRLNSDDSINPIIRPYLEFPKILP